MTTEYERKVLRERFHKVILGAGYNEEAAQGILDKYLEEYLTNTSAFIVMLESYEKESK